MCQDVPMTEVVRPWRGVSADDRRTERRARLLESCLDVVGDVGVDGATVDAIVERAGLSKRYFYESFADRNDVLAEAFDELMNRVRRRIVLAVAEPEAAGRLRAMVATLVRALAEDPRSARLYVEAGRSPATESRRHRAFDEFSALVVDALFDSSSDDPRTRATALLIVAGTTDVLARWLAGGLALDETEVVDLIAGIGERLS
jgi:AcrR family transcriptional regulator